MYSKIDKGEKKMKEKMIEVINEVLSELDDKKVELYYRMILNTYVKALKRGNRK